MDKHKIATKAVATGWLWLHHVLISSYKSCKKVNDE